MRNAALAFSALSLALVACSAGTGSEPGSPTSEADLASPPGDLQRDGGPSNRNPSLRQTGNLVTLPASTKASPGPSPDQLHPPCPSDPCTFPPDVQ